MLRLAKKSDFEWIYGLYMHPAVNPFLLYEYMDSPDFEPIYQKLVDAEQVYIFNFEGKDAGMFKMVRLEHRTSHVCYIGGLAIHPDFSGKGLGVLMIKEMIELAKSFGIKRIELSTATDNFKAQRLYEKVGFEKEGILRKYTSIKSSNTYLDEVMMSLIMD